MLALRAGSVPEIVKDGVSGYVSRRIDTLVCRARDLHIQPAAVRRYVEENFSQERMAQDYHALYTQILNGARAAQDAAAEPFVLAAGPVASRGQPSSH